MSEDVWGDAYHGFMQAPGRPDWLVTLADENPSIRERLARLLRAQRPLDVVLLTTHAQPTSLVATTGCCRYCRAPRDRTRTRCENCGAPYPALRVA